jgi:putative NADPH-quinone reductase
MMRVLVLYAHPLADSYHGALHRTVVERLTAAGHEVDDCDLYQEGFDPVLSAEERRRYFEPEQARDRVQPYIDRVFAAQGLVFCFPVWCYGMPAILKGFMDRVMIPGVSFRLEDDGAVRPNLAHIRALSVVATYGRSRLEALYFADPPRMTMTRYFRWFLARDARVASRAHYNIHKTAGARLQRFHDRVASHMDGFGG